MSRWGLEWIHRLAQEPGRLWRRYLVDSRRVVPIFTRMALDRITGRTHLRVCRLP
jgi:UDP-N-acetyl-D-mannosaminuronic acid transferase (WecB/TagA/CpsF family)